MPKRILSVEYKRECVELVMIHGHRQKEVTATMGVGLSTIQRWVRQYRKEQREFTPKAVAITPEQQRIQALEAQVKQLKSDNQLLKKASVDSSEQRNSYTKILIYRRTFDETYQAHLYPRRERFSL